MNISINISIMARSEVPEALEDASAHQSTQTHRKKNDKFCNKEPNKRKRKGRIKRLYKQ